MLENDMKKFIKTALWVVLGAMFLMAGGAKLMGSHSQVEHFAQWGYPLWFLYLTGIIEVGGGICLFIPKAQFYGIVVLSLTMVGAALTHLRAHEMNAFPVPVVLLCLLVLLAWSMRHPPKSNEVDHYFQE
jgi:putative oxidoreductase